MHVRYHRFVGLTDLCRHSEAIPVLYGENLWNQTVELVACGSLPLTKYLLPEQLCNIYWLQFDLNLGGDLSLGVLHDFPNLRRLDIRAFDFNPHSQFTARQLWQKLESVLPALQKLGSTKVTIFVEDCIPFGNSPFALVPLKTDIKWFFNDFHWMTVQTTGDSVVIDRVRSEA